MNSVFAYDDSTIFKKAVQNKNDVQEQQNVQKSKGFQEPKDTHKSDDIQEQKKVEEQKCEHDEACPRPSGRDIKMLQIPCEDSFEGYGSCMKDKLCVEIEDSRTDQYNGKSNRAKGLKYLESSEDGYLMTWGLANKVCEEKNMRLPKAVELHHMYLAQKNGKGKEFYPENYWAESIGNDIVAHNCSMGNGYCGRHHVDDLQRVRCVEK